MIRDFIVHAAEDGSALLGTTLRIDAQDGHTFSLGNNINNGDGIGELGAGYDLPDGMISVINWTGKRTTPQIPLARIIAAGAAGEQGITLVDGPFGPQTRLAVLLPPA
jgi:hypothetical protein